MFRIELSGLLNIMIYILLLIDHDDIKFLHRSVKEDELLCKGRVRTRHCVDCDLTSQLSHDSFVDDKTVSDAIALSRSQRTKEGLA